MLGLSQLFGHFVVPLAAGTLDTQPTHYDLAQFLLTFGAKNGFHTISHQI
jgi:hypothetical protein